MVNRSHSHQLRLQGLRVTSARMAVLAILEAASQPLDVETIYTTFQQKKLRVNPVTLYRVLEQLVEKQLIKRIDVMEGKFRYDTINHHHHLVCKQCHTITPIEWCILEPFEHEIELRYKVKIDDHSLEFFGICAGCC